MIARQNSKSRFNRVFKIQFVLLKGCCYRINFKIILTSEVKNVTMPLFYLNGGEAMAIAAGKRFCFPYKRACVKIILTMIEKEEKSGNLSAARRKKLTAIRMLIAGATIAAISAQLSAGMDTLLNCRRMLLRKDIAKLMSKTSGRPKKMNGRIEKAICKAIDRGSCANLKSIKTMINNKFKINLSITSTHRLLKKLGLKKLAAGGIPGKANFAEQEIFYKKTLSKLLAGAHCKGKSVVFADASHFVYADGWRGSLYGSARRYVRVMPGRSRWSVFGAIDCITKEFTCVSTDKTIKSEQVCRLIEKLSGKYAGIELTIVLDNAKVNVAKAVKALAANRGIKLVFLPACSPNLNLIERVWKVVKTDLRNTQHNNYEEFKKCINNYLSSTHTTNKMAIDQLFGKGPQLFTDLVKINENQYANSRRNA
jgi:transposase